MATQSLDGGRLILWQGRPGTGKTYALGALGRAWRDRLFAQVSAA